MNTQYPSRHPTNDLNFILLILHPQEKSVPHAFSIPQPCWLIVCNKSREAFKSDYAQWRAYLNPSIVTFLQNLANF